LIISINSELRTLIMDSNNDRIRRQLGLKLASTDERMHR